MHSEIKGDVRKIKLKKKIILVFFIFIITIDIVKILFHQPNKVVSNIYDLESEEIKDNTEKKDEINTSKITSNEFFSVEEVTLEYRDSEKIQNYKDFNFDIDGDGEIDKITIRRDKNYEYDENYIFELNGEKFTENSFKPVIYIIDFDKSDNKLEVLIFDNGPSDDPEYSIYRKNGNKMEIISTINGSGIIIDENGNFKLKTTLTNFISPDVYDKIYHIEESGVISENIKIDTACNYTAYNCYVTKDIENIEKFQKGMADYDPDKDNYNTILNKNGIEQLSDDETFTLKSIISETRAKIEYNDEEYYLLSIQGNFAD